MDTNAKLEAVDASEMTLVDGGIWDYSNRLGFLGAMLEARQNAQYDDVINPKNLDQAADQVNHGWVAL